MLLDFLRPHMDVSDNEAFSVYPGKTNNKPGDIIKGRTFRGLNVTRKIIVKDVPHLIRSALDMQTFALGQKCISQCRGSPMGSPLPQHTALWLSPSANKFGPLQSNKPFPITTFSFVTSATPGLRRFTPQRLDTILRPPGRWLLWKTHHPDRTGPGILGLHVGDETI